MWTIANVSWNGTLPRCELGACGSPFGEEAEEIEENLIGALQGLPTCPSTFEVVRGRPVIANLIGSMTWGAQRRKQATKEVRDGALDGAFIR